MPRQGSAEQESALLDRTIQIKLGPDQPRVRARFGDAWQAADVWLKRNNHIVAAYLLQQISDQLPDQLGPQLKLLRVHRDFMRLDEAHRVADRLLRQFPYNPRVLIAVARFCQIDNNPERAIHYLEQVLNALPDHKVALHLMCSIYQSMGDEQHTKRYLDRALSAAPHDPNIILSAARVLKSSASPEFFRRVQQITARQEYTGKLQALLHYAMAWLTKPDSEAHFQHLQAANAIATELNAWDGEAAEATRRRNHSLFHSADLQALQRSGDSSFRPIFIAAMPRSGTTLLEQMIGAHSEVFCVGERGAFDIALASSVFSGHTLAVASSFDQVDNYESALSEVMTAYRDSRQVSRAEGKRIIDKSIGNWNAIGMILLAFPNARIIHVERHPLDIIYSCYQQSFDTGHFYSNDLRDLARMYRIYQQQMEDWKHLFPGQVYSIRYENLVNNQEGELRRLFEYCDLAWENSCLDYRRAMGSITTASDQQVRQALYSSSVNKWQVVEKHLLPAIEELGELATYPAVVSQEDHSHDQPTG